METLIYGSCSGDASCRPPAGMSCCTLLLPGPRGARPPPHTAPRRTTWRMHLLPRRGAASTAALGAVAAGAATGAGAVGAAVAAATTARRSGCR